jgi:hypothetical protein
MISNAEVEFDDLLRIRALWALELLFHESDVANSAIVGSAGTSLQPKSKRCGPFFDANGKIRGIL